MQSVRDISSSARPLYKEPQLPAALRCCAGVVSLGRQRHARTWLRSLAGLHLPRERDGTVCSGLVTSLDEVHHPSVIAVLSHQAPTDEANALPVMTAVAL